MRLNTSIKLSIEENLYRNLRTAAKGSGASLTSWRFEYLSPLLHASAQEWEPFANFVTALAMGAAPGVREVLSLGRATALSEGNAGVRPLVCHKPMRRLITRALVFDARDNIQAHLSPHQFAVRISGGCPAMALNVKKLASKHPHLIFFKLDLVNACNTQSRDSLSFLNLNFQ